MTSPLRQPLLHCLALFLCLDLFRSSQVLAQSGDGGGAQGVEPGDIGAGPSSTDAGAEGPDVGSVNLSKGATIAIAVVVSVVVVLGITMAVLYYGAKKRQWKVKENIRRSARKVTNGVKAVMSPLTPKKMTFSPIETRQRGDESFKRANEKLSKSRPGNVKKEKEQQNRDPSSSSSNRDLEKGVPVTTVRVEPQDDTSSTQETAGPKKDRRRPRPPSVTIPSSAFEMDSPKTPMWKKVFGR